ncbi:MAG: DUF4976 domain-containing protein [Opitutales bacterium]|nr:DUF4976 domain-containing protein [Opitutales bacterium]
MPGKVNPGYMFTNNRFFEGLMGTIENAEEPIRSAYLNMERPVEYELYDLKNDPHEFSNLINDSSHAKELARLKKELQAWREETNDPMLNPRNVLRLKAEVNACFTDGQPDKKKLTLTYPEYFFE